VYAFKLGSREFFFTKITSSIDVLTDLLLAGYMYERSSYVLPLVFFISPSLISDSEMR